MGIIGIETVAQSRGEIRRRTRGFKLRDLIALVPLITLLLLAIVAPYFLPFSSTEVVGPSYHAPTATYLFGTDSAGLDVYSRTISATRLDCIMGVLVAILATCGGVILGVVLGINEPASGPRGLAARALSRLMDLVQAVPAILVGVVAVAFYGTQVSTLVIAIAIILCPLQARLVRTEVLRVRNEGYVEAGRIAGANPLEIAIRHILPNAVAPALQNMSVIFGIGIIIISGLGFIGVGLTPPTAEWGTMLGSGATDALQGMWWSAAFPAVFLAFAVTSVAFTTKWIFSKRK
jgi:peptide/nickel transport system permease protein